MFLNGGCEKVLDLKKPASTPVAVFDELWSVMDRNYSLFAIKNIDWKTTYTEYRARVSNDMNDNDLFRVLSTMLETLKDGHVTLSSASQMDSYDNFYKAYAPNFNYVNVINNYLKNVYNTSGPFIYKIVDSIGYIYYGSFENDISEEQLDNLLAEMNQKTKGLIIDVRNNFGGKSINADKLFSRFISEKMLVKYETMKKGPGHDDFFAPEPFFLSPKGQVFAKPVVVLTNRSCFSTCNDFVLFMSELPNVKRYGDQTGGGGGIPHDYLLANGWKIQYTATVTLSPEKINIENGIMPTVNINITPIDDTNGKDPILENAFLVLH
jgi:Peptidase family S41/Tricorn protease C1 domain